jgi:hypothetical protein
MRIVYASILIAAYVYLVVFMPVDDIPQLQHHEVQPRSCQDEIAARRHWLAEASSYAEDDHEKDMLLTWYADSFNMNQVRRACSDRKLTALVMFRLDVAEVIVARSQLPAREKR